MENKKNGLNFALLITDRLYGFATMQPYWLDGLTVKNKVLSTEDLTPTQHSIVKECAECEDGVLLKKFSHGEVTVMNLLHSLEENKQAEELFWKYVGKRYLNVVELLMHNPEIKVYYRKSNTNLVYQKDAISVCENLVVPRYRFKLTNEGLVYRFRFSNGAQPLDMRAGNALVVLSKGNPCIFVLNNMLLATHRVGHKAIAAMAKRGFIIIPPEKVDLYLKTFVCKVLQTDDIACEGMQVTYTKPDMYAKLTATTDTFGKQALRLDFCYDGTDIPFYTEQKHQATVECTNGTYTFHVCKRNFKQEDRLKQLLDKHGVKSNGEYLYATNAETQQVLLADAEIKANFTTIQEFEITTYADEKEDWFDVKMLLTVRGFRIPFAKLRHHILKHETTYQLPDGTTFHIPEEWFSNYTDLFEHAETEGDNIRLKKRYAGLIADTCTTAKNYLDQFTCHLQEVPQKVNATLRSYQKTGYSFLLNLYQNNCGGCLADDMGLGKTLQFIAFFAKIYDGASHIPAQVPQNTQPWKYATSEPSLFDQQLSEEDLTPSTSTAVSQKPASLVVVPTTVLFNWEKELQKFAPSLHYTIHYGAKRVHRITSQTFNAYHLVLTTYSMLQRDADKLCNYHFECAVLDESQNIKNPQSQLHTAAKQLQANCRFVITGTPIENSLNDLWAQFSFACPGLLGSYHSFTSHYTATQSDRLGALKKLVSAYILRRTKAEVCPDLPDLTKTDIWCEMDEDAKSAYEAEKSAARNAMLCIGTKNNALHVLQQLTRLRQLACDPALLSEHASLASAKRKSIVEHAAELHQSGL